MGILESCGRARVAAKGVKVPADRNQNQKGKALQKAGHRKPQGGNRPRSSYLPESRVRATQEKPEHYPGVGQG